MSLTTRPDLTPATRRSADALRTAADQLADWSAAHDTPDVADRVVERAADWGRGTARRIEDEPGRALAYEAERTLRRRPWLVPLTMLAGTALGFAVAAVVTARRRRAERARQIERERADARA